MNKKNTNSAHKILVITRGDYITRLTLETLLRSHPPDSIHVIVVSSDSHGRSGMKLLKAMWRDYERHYFFFELYQFFVFKFAQLLFPKTPFTVRALAKSCNIPVTVTNTINTPDILAFARNWQPDILVSVKCTQRIHSALLSVAKFGAINVHGSLLPKYAGRAPHFWAMAHAEKIVGTTVHFMTESFDEGDVLINKSIVLAPAMSVFSVIKAVGQLGNDALMEAMPTVLSNAKGTPQDISQRCYFSSPTEAGYKRLRNNGYKLFGFGELLKTIYAEIRSERERLTESR
jgi:folate-dependent phosphoribosylglycinamide formyltransferase PurN